MATREDNYQYADSQSRRAESGDTMYDGVGSKKSGEYSQSKEFITRALPGITRVLTPEDHFYYTNSKKGVSAYDKISSEDTEYITRPTDWNPTIKQDYLYTTNEHFTLDPNNDTGTPQGVPYYRDADGNLIRTFSGSATIINPMNDDYTKEVMFNTISTTEEKDSITQNGGDTDAQPPISPFHPFTRMDPYVAQKTILTAYNRTHIPVADNEFRKGYRHIFISRPECYITCREGGLSNQAAYDEDFASMYTRMPYILEMLSPSYLHTSRYKSADGLDSNWNFLLSNRAVGLSTETFEIGNELTRSKTTSGFSISTAGAMSGGYANGTLQLTFRETKKLEVYEMLRMWMLYMHKVHVGAFAPSYNGYQKENGFGSRLSKEGCTYDDTFYMHPYDRALDYPCTIFDIVTNESDTKILYFAEYMGAYPTQLSIALNNDNNAAIPADMKVSATFAYQFKIVNSNRVLMHFNYNSGLTDSLGIPKGEVKESLPFLLSDNVVETNKMLNNYIGAAGMFTGSPYIVIGQSQLNPIDRGSVIQSPFLKFAPITDKVINDKANLGIVNENNQSDGSMVGLSKDITDYSPVIELDNTTATSDSIDMGDSITDVAPKKKKSLYENLVQGSMDALDEMSDTLGEGLNTLKEAGSFILGLVSGGAIDLTDDGGVIGELKDYTQEKIEDRVNNRTTIFKDPDLVSADTFKENFDRTVDGVRNAAALRAKND